MDKRILAFCLVVALAFVLLVPVRAGAASSVTVEVHPGTPQLRSSQYTNTDPDNWKFYYDLDIPVSLLFASGESDWYLGYWLGLTEIFMSYKVWAPDSSAGSWSLSGIDLPDGFTYFVRGDSRGRLDSSKYLNMNANVVVTLPANYRAPSTDFWVTAVLHYRIETTKAGINSFSDVYSASASANQIYCNRDGWNPPEQQISYQISVWGQNVVSAVNTLKDNMVARLATINTTLVDVKSQISSWSLNIFNKLGDFKTSVDTAFTSLQNSVVTWGTNIRDSVATWGKNVRDSVVSWGGVINNKISSSFSALQTWLQTHTDNIIDAIKGSGGGANIDTAQSDLDNQLTQIENVENQLSQSVLDKVEVPSLSLSADQSSGLRWVVTTINDIYVALPEFHVMFACVFFFGVVGVLVFGRRNL